MEVTNYYVTTLTNAFIKIGPVVIFLVGGYFIFYKLPFLFLLRNMKKTKEDLHEEQNKLSESLTKAPAYSVEDYEKFVDRKKRLEALPSSGSSHKKEKKAEEKKKEEPKKEAPGKNSDVLAERLFEIRPGQTFSKEELKRKYHELLKMNHPDKVAALSPDFKNLADKKTKEINTAYNKLLKRAS